MSQATIFQTKSGMMRFAYLRDLLRELVARDMKLRYKRSVLGMVWSLINPLAQLVVFTFVFRYVLRVTVENFTLFLFTGLLAWTWFSSSLSSATGAIVANGMLIRRPGFPAAILPIVTVTTYLIHYVLALPILLLFLVLSDVQVTWALLALPLVLALQFVLTLSLAYIVSAVHVTFRDTQYLLEIVLLLGFYLSPIFYEIELVPERMQTIYGLNPMVHLLSAYRAIFLEGRWPIDMSFLWLLLGSLLMLGVGYSVFRRASYRFVEEI